MRVTSLGVVMLAVVACGGSTKKPAPPPSNTPVAEAPPAADPDPPPPAASATVTDAEFDAVMARAVAMFVDMGNAVDAGGSDCGKVADGLNKVLDDHADFIREASSWKNNPDLDTRASDWMKANMDQVMPSLMKVGTAGTKCASDAKFAAVMKRLDAMD